MRYPLDELIDKRSIIQLKIERLEGEERGRLRKEFDDYSVAIQEYVAEGACTNEKVNQWHNELYGANGKTWDLESDIRKGQLGKMPLEEIGKRAIAIRESNGVRVRIKSRIVDATGVGYKDVKINHASQGTQNQISTP